MYSVYWQDTYVHTTDHEVATLSYKNMKLLSIVGNFHMNNMQSQKI